MWRHRPAHFAALATGDPTPAPCRKLMLAKLFHCAENVSDSEINSEHQRVRHVPPTHCPAHCDGGTPFPRGKVLYATWCLEEETVYVHVRALASINIKAAEHARQILFHPHCETKTKKNLSSFRLSSGSPPRVLRACLSAASCCIHSACCRRQSSSRNIEKKSRLDDDLRSFSHFCLLNGQNQAEVEVGSPFHKFQGSPGRFERTASSLVLQGKYPEMNFQK